MESVTAGNARLHMRDILSAVERGEQVMITRYDRPTAVVAPVAGAGAVVTEYGRLHKSGDVLTWETEPPPPAANLIANPLRQGGRVYRRRVIVVEDWTEVGEP
jgi:antitoxin (DNA-binding transcriptional repressor) of toxin-antitoxin stability system